MESEKKALSSLAGGEVDETPSRDVSEWFGVTGAWDETEALAVALFDARCPGIRMTDEDLHYYLAAAQRAMQAVAEELDAPALTPRHEALAEGAGERVYIDCEFDGHNGPLLSVALVRESGDSIHIRADVEPMDLWVRQNVLPLMDSHKAARSEKVYAYEVGGVIRSFLGEGSPVIVCDSPQDARYFSQALTTAPDGGYAPFPFDGLTIEVLGVDAYPTTLEGAVQHNAWWDAMALREALRAHSSAPEARDAAD